MILLGLSTLKTKGYLQQSYTTLLLETRKSSLTFQDSRGGKVMFKKIQKQKQITIMSYFLVRETTMLRSW